MHPPTGISPAYLARAYQTGYDPYRPLPPGEGNWIVQRPTASPALTRDVQFAAEHEARAYIDSLPAGAGWVLVDGCVAVDGTPWDYWPTEEQIG